MPIRDYERDAKVSEKAFFDNLKISKTNKGYMRSFLLVYDVRPATKAKFFKHIKYLLESTQDIKKEMVDRNAINNVFSELKQGISKGYYFTLINCARRFVRWLNDGEYPKGFKDIKSPSKKEQLRNLKPEDMWEWKEAKEVIKHTTSIQLKAAFMTQVSEGFRPSEFVDLNYGDIVVKKDIVIFKIRDGKTGSRNVPCFRSTPYFLKWFESHPTKKPNDPLWILESNKKSSKKPNGVTRYDYYAILRRFELMSKRAKINKPVDFYNLRHSSCALDKKDNTPLDIAAERHGHSVAYFVKVYGRLDLDQEANRLRSHYNPKEKEKKMMEQPKLCERCGHTNEAEAQLCFKCGSPLTLAVALNWEMERDALQSRAMALLTPDMLKDLQNNIKAELMKEMKNKT